MSKIIRLEFDEDGILQDYSVDEIRQGDMGVELQAFFEDKNNANYIARLNFTRHDTKQIKNVLLNASADEENEYTKILDSAWYFAIAGETTLTIFLTDGSGNTLANGQVTFAVQKTDYSDEPTITPDEYEELLEEIAKKLNIKDGILKSATITALGNLGDYTVGQLFFIEADHTLYQLNASYNLTKVFDFDHIKAHSVEDIDFTLSRNELNNVVYLQLIDSNGLAIVTGIITIHPATTTYAGLMSASDKATFNEIPNTYETKAHASSTYETKDDHDDDINDLQSQIDAIISKSDVVDIVSCYDRGADTSKTDIVHYDKSKLGDNDIVKVLDDETHQNTRAYYRFRTFSNQFYYVGSEAESYTKAESDLIFLTKVDAENTYQHKVIYGSEEPENPSDNDVWVNDEEEEPASPTKLYKHTFTDEDHHIYTFITNNNRQIEYDEFYSGYEISAEIVSVSFYNNNDGTRYKAILLDVGQHSGSNPSIINKLAIISSAGTISVVTIPADLEDVVTQY